MAIFITILIVLILLQAYLGYVALLVIFCVTAAFFIWAIWEQKKREKELEQAQVDEHREMIEHLTKSGFKKEAERQAKRILPANELINVNSKGIRDSILGMVAILFFLGLFIYGGYKTDKEREESLQFIAGKSPTCGEIAAAENQMDRVKRFCNLYIATGVAGVDAFESILTVKVTHDLAQEMLANRLLAEQILLKWLRGWLIYSHHETATVMVKLGSVKLATAQTTAFSGNKVDFHR